MRRAIGVLASAAALLGAAPLPDMLAEQRARLAAAKAEALVARQRSRTLDRAAASERDAARKARIEEAAVTARIRGSEAALAAAAARVTMTARLLSERRTALAERQAPILRLIAAVQSFARRPAAAAIVQPGSVRDAVHVRAMLGTILPVVTRRTAVVREEIARVRRLQQGAGLAARTLRDSRAQLESERLTLVRMEAMHRLRSQELSRSVLFESDRAIAMGERARDIVGHMATLGDEAAIRATLARLDGPLPRPMVGDDAPLSRFTVPPYRLPTHGHIAQGLGELTEAGVRSRGLTLATASGAPVLAPAAGRLMFARRFRGYGVVVILDHGGGWTSTITGLETATATAKVGAILPAGAPLGRAATGEEPRITVELRRRGVPIDLTALIG